MEVVGYHLHTEPVPPSQRGDQPIPAELEALILQCLEKSPEARFPTARSLTQALAACAHGTPWSQDNAEEQWESIEQHRHHEPRPAAPGAPPTLAIDLGNRVQSAEEA